MKRFNQKHLDEWNKEGGVLITNFFSEKEIKPCRQDMDLLYGDRRDATASPKNNKQKGEIGSVSPDQFRNFDDMPFACSPALNLLALHPSLIELAKAALGTDSVHLYQSHSWAKFTGEADFDQDFHCDFKNHTLTVPSQKTSQRTINCMIYLTDVTDELGAIHYVPLSESEKICGDARDPFGSPEVQAPLKKKEVSCAAASGSIFAYGIDVYHRGTNLTLPSGVRYTLTASFKAAGNDMIGWSAWPYSFLKPWHLFFEHCTPDQLSCLGVPMPGDPFWTEQTIRRNKNRWPMWDESPYLESLDAG